MEKEYLTVKEYAEIKGCSTQYVYRILKTKLQPYVVEVEGKKCLKIDALTAEETNQPTNETNQTNQVSRGRFSASSSSDYEEMKRINERNESIIDDLRQQLKEKDIQIKEQSEHIVELSSRITELFENNQKLQLNYQFLLGTPNEQTDEEVDVEGGRVIDEDSRPPKKKSFFSKWFK